MKNKLAPATIEAAIQFRNSIKCLSCKELPTEPYSTGICDDLLCKKCISKSNTCPVCGSQFFKKDISLNKTLKETIINLNEIIELTDKYLSDVSLNENKENEKDEKAAEDESKNNSDSDDSSLLPDLDMGLDDDVNNEREPDVSVIKPISTKNNIATKSKSKESEVNMNSTVLIPEPSATASTSIFAIPLAPNAVSDSISSQLKGKSNKNSKPKSSTQKASQSTVKKSNNAKLDSTQQTQSATKRLKKNDKGETPLHIAVMAQDIEKVKELLNDPNVDINAKDFASWTPLHEACGSTYNLEIVKCLLENNADINALGFQNNTPLHEASLNKKFECVKHLLENGANPSIRNSYGIIPKEFVKDLPNFVELFDMYNNINKNIESNGDSDPILQSQFNADESINSSYSKRSRSSNKLVKKAIVFGTGMTNEDKSKLNSLASKLNIQVAKEMNNNVTHILYSGTSKISAFTLNYMKGILMGAWIVSIKWLEDSVEKGFLVEENNYEAIGSTKHPNTYGPFKGRVNASCQYPKLFEDCHFYLQGNFHVFEKKDIIKLIEMSGGQILKREPKLERAFELAPAETPYHIENNEENKEFNCSHFILYDAPTKITEIKHRHLNTVKTNWLFMCIDEFRILKPNN